MRKEIQENPDVDEMEEDTQKGKFMTFHSGNEDYGIELKYVNEIIKIQNITKIPEVEEYIKGLINLRGKIIPVIDIRLRFKQEPIAYSDRTCIIIIDVNATIVGLIVEKIAGVVMITEDNILPPPTLGNRKGNTKNRYIYGLGKTSEGVTLLIDPEKLLKEEELELFDELAQEDEELLFHGSSNEEMNTEEKDIVQREEFAQK